MKTALPKLRRLGLAVGSTALIALATAGCASIPGERTPVGFDVRGGTPVVAGAQNPTLPTINPRDTKWGRGLFGTVNPGARVGRRLHSQHLIGQLPFGLEYDRESLRVAAQDKLSAARLTERRESWMDVVTGNNNAFRAGRGQALMVGIDPHDPINGARDFAEQYHRLWNYVSTGTTEERTQRAEIMLQSYRDTMAARQNTAMLLQVEQRLEHFQDYAQLELGRRVLGDVLIRAGVFTEREIRSDTAPTYGFLNATAIGAVAYEGAQFGPQQVLLADDRSQSAYFRDADPMTQVENRYVRDSYNHIRRDADQYNRIRAEAARRGITSAPPMRALR
ncbi:MAG TPA: hypothetical protein DFI00_12990 [Rhodospirillaceae bacterium]|nr:hypothetical protein [Alphaproteobacteria bacterium]OUT41562.1 MAG: hypothetical protein CBB62_04305 [Micavibrio sp. TMED2]HCI48202.1 hypothetical protein [Rhodospirillaceae bacterium]MAS46877.1 hypothetical protein [Alphaproteobacteria bacterium]MAX94972.1 hypothetical protein [Alphaproteobacteria bacterium]|tara:strand:- start:3443 stop:4447 length:1005 start_codon:yes stop_codon:yes gene_type:complete